MNVPQVLDTAKQTVLKHRNKEYGEKSRVTNHQDIAKLWSVLIGTEITAQQVALMMVMLKVVRANGNPMSEDSYVDMCGYAAIAAEIVEEEYEEPADYSSVEALRNILSGAGTPAFDETLRQMEGGE